MLQRNYMTKLAQCTFVLCLGAGVAQAQANPELGDTGGSAQVGAGGSAQGTWQPPTTTQPAATDTAATTEEAAPAGDSDHAGVVGTFGIGYFGFMDIPVGGCGPTCTATTVSAPTLGIRYWMAHNMGIEAAVGLHMSSSGTTTKATSAAAEVEANGPSYIGFGLHGGLPLVLADTGHFAFEVIPELNFGIASGSLDTGAANADVSMSGMLFELGARAGAEIQFGFIDIPQLALQATIGAHLGLRGTNSEVNGGGTQSTSAFNFGTSVQDAPWRIFNANIAAIYYF